MFGTVVVAKRLAWSGLVKRANRLHLEFRAEEGKESGWRGEAGKTEQDIQEVLHEHRGISCDDRTYVTYREQDKTNKARGKE